MTTPTFSVLIGGKSTVGSIKSWVAFDNVPSEYVLGEAETEIYRRLRIREMLTRATGTIATAATTISLPSRFIASRQLRITGANWAVLTPRRLDDLEAAYTYDSDNGRSSGKPCRFAIDAENILLDVESDADYPYSFLHYQRLAALAASSNETNVLTDKYPRVLRAMCCAMAQDFLQNETERDYWLKVAGEAIEAANRESDLSVRDTDMRVIPV